jgi:hypothetical protein
MSTSAHPTEHWNPASPEDRELVMKELEAILASYHFRGSKRYPAMLRYVVGAALEGHAGDLKERTLGVEVFGRDPDYDTSADPVVRFSAGEVRKRIAQYYHENGNGSLLQIELPLGSYAPEFLLRPVDEARTAGETRVERPAPAYGSNDKTRGRGLLIALTVTAFLLAGAGAGTYAYLKLTTPGPTASDGLWAPLVKPPGQILIVVGTSHNGEKRAPETPETTFLAHMTGPYHHVSVAIATSLANMAGGLREYGKIYEIKEDTETSLTDVHARSLILIGATNNTWTMRLVSPLRYSFKPGPLAKIQDAKNPDSTEWQIDFTQPYAQVAVDYAIVARYRDSTTEGPVMVVAGIGPYGTEAASAFVSTPQYLEQIAKQLPAGWENKNIEMVIKTDVIDGKAGPPVLVASTVWY